jgi:DNA polymerase-1
MIIYNSTNLPKLNHDEQLWIYNALDVAVTREVFDRQMESQLPGFAYDMPRAMQGPAFTMMRRGVAVDAVARNEESINLLRDIAKLESIFNQLAAAWDLEINWRSPQQLMQLFYGTLGLEPIMVYDKLKRERRPSVNREALEKLSKFEFARHFCECILQARGLKRLYDVINSGLDPDNRLRCSYQVAGTMTGRWSSNESAFHTGTNLQNITDRARRIIIPDPGKVMVQNDLPQAESRVVAAISKDSAYREACDSGDLHTTVARMIWPDIGWPSDPKEWKDFAENTKYYRHFSYRDMAKRGGHACNYGATARIIALGLNIPVAVAEDFISAYFGKFKQIRNWHARVAAQLARNNTITTYFGRRCHFYGRPGDTQLLKSAIAYEPQSIIGDVLNLGLYNVWKNYDLPGKIELLLQVHDAVVWQVNEAEAPALIPEIINALYVPVEINGFSLKLVPDATAGYNWGKRKVNKKTGEVENPHGQRPWKELFRE